MAIGKQEIDNRFGFHPATPETIPLHEQVRTRFAELAYWLDETLPDSREKSLTFTELQVTAMHANATIACNLAPLEKRAAPLTGSEDEPPGSHLG